MIVKFFQKVANLFSRSRRDLVDSDSHPLDGCDEGELYKNMMEERKDLIKAWRESEDTFIKTIIQINSILVGLAAGFLTQTTAKIYENSAIYIIIFFFLSTISLVFAMTEFLFSAKANKDQQKIVENFYSKKTKDIPVPWANRFVKICQFGAFITFVLAVALLAFFAFKQAQERLNEQSKQSAATAATAATATAAAATATATATATAN